MSKPLRALIIEDSEDYAVLLAHKLTHEGGYELVTERVESLEGLNRALDGKEWEIIFCDHSMPRFSALQALEALRERQLDIPLLIVSGTIEPEAAVAAMRAGARDFIMKHDPIRLLPAIERELREAGSRREKRATEHKLNQARKMESIGRLAGGLAHDFNNILTAIIGYADLIAVGPASNGAWREDVTEIRKAAERAALLTSQLLAFSRRQAILPKVMDLNVEFADLEKMLRRMVGEDIDWETSLATGLGCIKADPGQIQQVVMNLVLNARDAMPDGGKLTVRTENVEFSQPHAGAGFIIPPGAYVAIAVGDTGVGMDENVQSHLFEPFFTTKEKGKGTGLGLAVIYGSVKQAGGFISVDSAPGKGTTFKIYFPKAEGAAGVRNAPRPAQESSDGTETILVVDDDASVRVMLLRVLRRHGYTVFEAGRGEEALQLVQAHKGALHLLLTDMVLPDLKGVELARRIASVRPEAKLLLISGYLDRDFGDFVVDANLPFLQKPFAMEALARKVREVLDAEPAGLRA